MAEKNREWTIQMAVAAPRPKLAGIRDCTRQLRVGLLYSRLFRGRAVGTGPGEEPSMTTEVQLLELRLGLATSVANATGFPPLDLDCIPLPLLPAKWKKVVPIPSYRRISVKLDSAVLCTLGPQMFVHWLLLQRVASVTPHPAVRHSLRFLLQVCYWLGVVQGVSNELRSNCKAGFMRRERCSPVESLAARGHRTLDVRGSVVLIAPVPLGLKHGKQLRVAAETLHALRVGAMGRQPCVLTVARIAPTLLDLGRGDPTEGPASQFQGEFRSANISSPRHTHTHTHTHGIFIAACNLTCKHIWDHGRWNTTVAPGKIRKALRSGRHPCRVGKIPALPVAAMYRNLFSTTKGEGSVGEIMLKLFACSAFGMYTNIADVAIVAIKTYTRHKAKSKYINRIRLESASQKQSSDTHKPPYDRVKRCQERKINIKASERVNVDQRKRRVSEEISSLRLEGWGEPGDPRENPPTSGIVRQRVPLAKIREWPGPGIEPDSPWWEPNVLSPRDYSMETNLPALQADAGAPRVSCQHSSAGSDNYSSRMQAFIGGDFCKVRGHVKVNGERPCCNVRVIHTAQGLPADRRASKETRADPSML
ncbi:hypothetical protein PR048_033286 [Dryococelus australis]|uniref:Uncharacterized protein n=1 Tax=Dryococelus australis TaxID=614101 RepID=A0ABQ9FZU7_9NEOP|nr:hypothetical protein PR048_033286 [Dryococelus australis]